MTDGLHAFAAPEALPPEPAPAQAGGAVPALTRAAWEATRPDLHLVDVRGGATHARLSLWHTRPIPMPDGGSAAAVGHAAWADADAGAALLVEALGRLRTLGAGFVVGPMDGSTWHTYRVVTDAAPGGGAPEPPFAMEPAPAPAVGEAFARAGFVPVARYLSSRVDALPDASLDLAQRLARHAEAGVTLAPVAPEALDAALGDVYRISRAAFAANPFYTPLPEAAFRATYAPLLPHLDPRLVWLARDASGEVVGFAFGVPDRAQAARGEAVDTVVVKTVAVDPARRVLGLGGTLVLALHEAARAAGYPRAIHALMHEANASTRISAHTACPMRRYALLGRAL